MRVQIRISSLQRPHSVVGCQEASGNYKIQWCQLGSRLSEGGEATEWVWNTWLDRSFAKGRGVWGKQLRTIWPAPRKRYWGGFSGGHHDTTPIPTINGPPETGPWRVHTRRSGSGNGARKESDPNSRFVCHSLRYCKRYESNWKKKIGALPNGSYGYWGISFGGCGGRW